MKQVNLRIYRMILPLILGLFLSVGTYAQSITVKEYPVMNQVPLPELSALDSQPAKSGLP